MDGSSPLAWGTSLIIRCAELYTRFIPTGVGNIGVVNSVGANIAVHPHWRGEHLLMIMNQSFGVGSSPLAWGT